MSSPWLTIAGLSAAIPGASAAFGATRTFVASTGVDSGVCSRAAPCRSFAYAVTQTSPSGELGNNQINGNGTDVSGTLTPAPLR